MYKYSIIIPTLNEEEFLPRVLTNLQKFTEELEIIISDGGSTDNTIKIAENLGAKVCSSKKGKGMQMNKAATEFKRRSANISSRRYFFTR